LWSRGWPPQGVGKLPRGRPPSQSTPSLVRSLFFCSFEALGSFFSPPRKKTSNLSRRQAAGRSWSGVFLVFLFFFWVFLPPHTTCLLLPFLSLLLENQSPFQAITGWVVRSTIVTLPFFSHEVSLRKPPVGLPVRLFFFPSPFLISGP